MASKRIQPHALAQFITTLPILIAPKTALLKINKCEVNMLQLLPLKLVLTLCFAEPQHRTLELYNPLTEQLIFEIPAASLAETQVSAVAAENVECHNLVLDEYTVDDAQDCELRAASLRSEIDATDYIGCVYTDTE